MGNMGPSIVAMAVCLTVTPWSSAQELAPAAGAATPPQAMSAAPPVNLVSSPNDRLQPFPVPHQLDSAIGFWSDLFLQHDSDQVIIHDKQYLQVVWQILALPHTAHGAVDERAARRMTRVATEQLRQRLRRLDMDPTPRDTEDAALLAIVGHQSEILHGAYKRLRSQRGVADQFRAGMERYHAWITEIRAILRQEGVPEEIAVLPFVESMFNPRAHSAVGAAGMWQLMPATARGLGLKVSRRADDRINVLKATHAAARMLHQNFQMLGSWPLAITAYNHGPSGVRRAVHQVGSSDLQDLIANYQQSTWGFASKNYYAEFLAVMKAVTRDPVDSPVKALAPAVSTSPAHTL